MKQKSLGAAVRWIVLASCLPTQAMAGEEQLILDLGGKTTLEMVKVNPGSFHQGSPEGELGRAGDESQRAVTLTRGFFIGKTPVTLAQWQRFVAESGFRSEAEQGTSGGFGWNGTALAQDKRFTWRDPGFPQSPDHPACIITFEDAQKFCLWLGRKTKRLVSLPTEAQWEYACRAETTSAWHSGAAVDANQNGLWHKGNSGNSTQPVSSMVRNSWGIHIGGNVSEWCLDWYAPYPGDAQVDPRQDNSSLSDKPRRVLRGGSWMRDAKNTRSASRWRSDPRSRNADIGFRVLCPLEASGGEAAGSSRTATRILERDDPPPAEPQVMPAPEQPVSIETHESSPSAPVTGIGRWLISLLCMMIPLGVIVWLIRQIADRGKSYTNPFVIGQKAPPPFPETASGIRKTDDGFWLNGEWSTGTRLRLHYVVEGDAHSQSIRFQPGPTGQFIYTGQAPQSVSVVTEEGAGSSQIPPLIPDASWQGGNRGDRLFREDREADRSPGRPPVFPSAY